MAVGFTLEPGARSDAVPGATIDISAPDPWNGGLFQGGPKIAALTGDAFNEASWRRWGKPDQLDGSNPLLPGYNGIPGAHTLHRSDLAAALMMVWQYNPEWLGPGARHLDGLPTHCEVEDAYMTSGSGKGAALLQEAHRLAPQDTTPAPPRNKWLEITGKPGWQCANWPQMLQAAGLGDLVPTARDMVMAMVRADPTPDLDSMVHGRIYLPASLCVSLWDQVHAAAPASAPATPAPADTKSTAPAPANPERPLTVADLDSIVAAVVAKLQQAPPASPNS